MSGYDIILAMGGIDDDLILDAKRHKRAIPVWLRWGALAACLCCVILAAGALSLNLLGREQPARQEAFGSGMEQMSSAEETSQQEENAMLLERNGYVILEDEEYGLKLEVPEDMAEDVVCNAMASFPFVLYEPTSKEQYSGTGDSFDTEGGFIWDIRVLNTQTLQNAFHWDGSDWCEGAAESGLYMLGTKGDLVFVFALPVGERATEETKEAYAQYQKEGLSILRRFIEINGISSNDQWEQIYPTGQDQTEPVVLPQGTDTQAEPILGTEPSELPDVPTEADLAETPENADAEAARDAGVYARDKVYSSKAEGVPAEALEEFTVWFESPATDGRGKFCTDPWSWTFSVTEGTDMAQWGDVMLRCTHENGLDEQVFFWFSDGTITWGPTASPGDA